MHEGRDECESDWMVGHPLTLYEAFRNVRMGASKLSRHQHKVLSSSSSKWDKIDKAKMKAKQSYNVNCARLPPFLKYLYIFICQDSVLGAFKVRWKRTDQLQHNVHTYTLNDMENWLRNMVLFTGNCYSGATGGWKVLLSTLFFSNMSIWKTALWKCLGRVEGKWLILLSH